jgi:hypothetical protein
MIAGAALAAWLVVSSPAAAVSQDALAPCELTATEAPLEAISAKRLFRIEPRPDAWTAVTLVKLDYSEESTPQGD